MKNYYDVHKSLVLYIGMADGCWLLAMVVGRKQTKKKKWRKCIINTNCTYSTSEPTGMAWHASRKQGINRRPSWNHGSSVLPSS